MRIALVSPPYDTQLFRIGENLGLRYCAAALGAAGYPVDVLEAALLGIDEAELVRQLTAGGYDMIGFSIMFDEASGSVAQTAGALREAGVKALICVGGHVPSFDYETLLGILPGVDCVVRFEGEATVVALARALEQRDDWRSVPGIAFLDGGLSRVTPVRPLIADLDTVPFPVRDETSRYLGDDHYFLVTTRGCPFVCTFCSVPAFYKEPAGPAWRKRSVGNVVDEMQWLVDVHGARAFSFLDDEFLVGRSGKQRARDLAQEIVARGLSVSWAFECRSDDVDPDLFRSLRDGGLRHVFLGIESGNQRVLDAFDKRTTVEQNAQAIRVVRELGLSLGVGFIMFEPSTTVHELRVNADFLAANRIFSYKALTNKVRVYRGTRLERDLTHDGLLRREGLRLDFSFPDPRVSAAYDLMRELLLPLHEVDQLAKRAAFQIDNLPAAQQGPAMAVLELAESGITSAFATLTGSILDRCDLMGRPEEPPGDDFRASVAAIVEDRRVGLTRTLSDLISSVRSTT
ncbi:cobalamin-dependent protein [Kineosporia sp. J2-2]|uniref:Cobalamin-dependent protein n=1 Tax=Kineosporia corallincola TaxID=2835133 RepID=A0ABS5TR32_9ACTN|nr:radical SAM protein [Kineosporia corallincola]MBT0772993.1 cobalamin-dependent protein [Kineosporia corallincola]